MIREIDTALLWSLKMQDIHICSSTTSAFVGGVLQGVITNSKQPSAEQMGEISRLLAGAQGVESALMVEEFDAVVDTICAQPMAIEPTAKPVFGNKVGPRIPSP